MTEVRLYYKHLSSAYSAFEVEMLTFSEGKYQILYLTEGAGSEGQQTSNYFIVTQTRMSETSQVPCYLTLADYGLVIQLSTV